MRQLLLTFLLLLGAGAIFGQDEASNPIIFITDASGSMWQKVGGEFKISLAREVLGELVGDMPANQAIGLVAYGHRAKGDCEDIESLLPLTNQDKAAFTQALEGLNPLGMTPLAQSARQVIQQLADQQQSATIILLTDGMETCEGDLCEVVEAAKAAGVDFVMHIVGFDLGDADRAPLECAARAGEGLYLDASDKDQLAVALEQASELRVDLPSGVLAVTCRRNDALVDALILAYKTGTEEEVARMRSYAHAESNPAELNLPDGRYDLEVSLVGKQGVQPIRKTGLQVKEGGRTEEVADFTAGYLSVAVRQGGKLHDATVAIRVPGQRKAVAGGRTYASASSNPMKKELTPGWYEVELKSVDIRGTRATTVLDSMYVGPGETVEREHVFEQSILIVGATHQGALCDAVVSIRDAETGTQVDGGRTYTSDSSNPKTFRLSPGTYEVSLQAVKVAGSPKEAFTVSLKAGETVEKKISW